MDPYAEKMRKLTEAVLQGPGHLPPETRRAAAAGRHPLAARVQAAAYEIKDAELQSTSYSEDELFELVVSAALGAATLRLERGLEALRCD